MVNNGKESTARKSIGRFARTLLATTCLTVASGVAALAGTITYTEGVNPVSPTDFPNTSPGTSLVAAANPGTTIVNGGVPGFSDIDWFELTGLGSGTFTLGATMSTGGAAIHVFDDTLNPLENASFTSVSGASFGALAIPGDGNLLVELAGANEGTNPYAVTVVTTGASVPEPATVACVGLGLAGALVLRRKRRQQS